MFFRCYHENTEIQLYEKNDKRELFGRGDALRLLIFLMLHLACEEGEKAFSDGEHHGENRTPYMLSESLPLVEAII